MADRPPPAPRPPAAAVSPEELTREMLGPMRHLHLLQRLGHPVLAFRRSHAAVGQRELDVLVDRKIPDEVEALEDEPDLPIPGAGTIGLLELSNGPVVQRIAPLSGGVQQTEDRQQGRFPRSPMGLRSRCTPR